MNILILSCGTRNKIIQYFKKELKGQGKVIAADCWELAPALYEADNYYIVPRISEENYVDIILGICQKENISGVFSLIDPELLILAQNKEKFSRIGTTVFVSDYEIIDRCFDKIKLFKFCKLNQINTIPTYKNFDEFKKSYENGDATFPVFIKPIQGSCSIQAQKIDDMNTLFLLCEENEELMIQKFMDGQEYGVDVYTDLLSNKITAIFIKRKLLMRAGETDKAVSIVRNDMFDFVEKFVELLGTVGQIDIDIFEQNGELYISEVNPRFGGGYPHAYECGVNFPQMMIANLQGKENESLIGQYKENVYMMKYLDVIIKRG